MCRELLNFHSCSKDRIATDEQKLGKNRDMLHFFFIAGLLFSYQNEMEQHNGRIIYQTLVSASISISITGTKCESRPINRKQAKVETDCLSIFSAVFLSFLFSFLVLVLLHFLFFFFFSILFSFCFFPFFFCFFSRTLGSLFFFCFLHYFLFHLLSSFL